LFYLPSFPLSLLWTDESIDGFSPMYGYLKYSSSAMRTSRPRPWTHIRRNSLRFERRRRRISPKHDLVQYSVQRNYLLSMVRWSKLDEGGRDVDEDDVRVSPLADFALKLGRPSRQSSVIEWRKYISPVERTLRTFAISEIFIINDLLCIPSLLAYEYKGLYL